MDSTSVLLSSTTHNKSQVSPVLRRVFSRPTFYPQLKTSLAKESVRRPESRIGADSPARDLSIDILTEENIQFMDQPLRGKIELTGLPAPIESVAIALRGVVKTCITGNAAWPSGFGGESNVTARFTERELLKQEFTLHPCTQPATPLSPDRQHTFPFVFLFPGAAHLPPSMTFPQGLGCVEYTLNVTLRGKRKFGGAKKWTSTLVLKVEVSRRAIGARLETMAVADAAIGKTKHVMMLEHPRIILPGYNNHYFALNFPQGLMQIHTFEATLVQRSFYRALGGNYRGASMVGLVCRVGQAEANIREAGMEKVHVEIQEVSDEGLESSVEVDGVIERKHLIRLEISAILFKRGIEKIFFEVPVTVQCGAVPQSLVDRKGTMSSMASASSTNLRYLSTDQFGRNIRPSRSLTQFPSPPTRTAPTFDGSPPESPTQIVPPTNLGRTRMNSNTWREDELPGIAVSNPTPQLQSPVKLNITRSRSRLKNWHLVKPGLTKLDMLAAPTPPPTCPIPDIPVSTPAAPSTAPIIPPRSSSRLASARHAVPSTRSRESSTTEEIGRRTSQDTMTASSIASFPSDYSGRHSTTSTAATSVSSSPGDPVAPAKTRGRQLSLRKVEEMGCGEPLKVGFNTKIFHGMETESRDFHRKLDLALHEVEKLALEESEGETSDGETDISPGGLRAVV